MWGIQWHLTNEDTLNEIISSKKKEVAPPMVNGNLKWLTSTALSK